MSCRRAVFKCKYTKHPTCNVFEVCREEAGTFVTFLHSLRWLEHRPKYFSKLLRNGHLHVSVACTSLSYIN